MAEGSNGSGPAGALAGLRVLDLCGRKGGYCGRLLANLGADVVLVEPPEGDATRHQGRFRAAPDPEESLAFAEHHTNKRGIVLDLSAEPGQERLKQLVRNVDVLIEDRPPGEMAGRGVGYEKLRAINPSLVMASITGFGQSGPYRDFKDPDLVGVAMGGLMATSGFPERQPIAGPGEASFKMASVHAAFGILLALYNRRGNGRGQHVEVSAQEVLVADPFRRLITRYSVAGEIVERDGTVSSGILAGAFPTQDGDVNLYVQAVEHWRRFVAWLGSPPELMDPALEEREVQKEHRPIIDPLVIAKTRLYKKEALTEELQGEHIACAPINSPGEFLADKQTLHRGFLTEVEHPRFGRHQFPGDPYILSETPWRVRRAAPLLGQHQAEVEGELESPSQWLLELAARPAGGNGSASRRPLFEGVRVVTFPTGVVGPCIARLFADHGAEVIAIESSIRPDGWGNQKPAKAVDAIGNRNKKRVTINMRDPEGLELARKLVATADVVTENFSARVMAKWGLDYPNARLLKPDLVMISLQAFGNNGPRSSYVSYGSTLLAHDGQGYLWRDPGVDKQGIGLSTYFPDYIAPSYGAMAVLAALNHRARTGQGQYIDLSQDETGAAFIGTAFLEQLVGGREPQPIGNASTWAAPHGCYRCKGADRWCVIAVETEAEWATFCRVAGHPEWESDARFAALADRLRNRAELDELVETWTLEKTPHQVMLLLQREGVAAGVVATSEDLYTDPHLRERGFASEVLHPTLGWMTQVGFTAKLSETPGEVRHLAHAIGDDNEAIFGELLGISGGQVRELVERKVLA